MVLPFMTLLPFTCPSAFKLRNTIKNRFSFWQIESRNFRNYLSRSCYNDFLKIKLVMWASVPNPAEEGVVVPEENPFFTLIHLFDV